MTDDPASLANLRDIVVPPPVALWPPAPGWWVIGAGLLAALAIVLWRWIQAYRADAYRREALRELARLSDPAGLLPVLKRAAMVAYGRDAVASLTGPAFLAFLDRTGATSAFTTGPVRSLARRAYAPDIRIPAEAADRALADARNWLSRHRREDS
jgi:hypothetical protein